MQLSALYALTQPLILASECVSQLKGKCDDDKKQKALPTDAGGAFLGESILLRDQQRSKTAFSCVNSINP